MNAHELNICAALADGVVVDLDPSVPDSGVLRSWLKGAAALRASGRPVTLATLSEYARVGALPNVPSPRVLDDSIAAVQERAVERRVRAAAESTLRGYRYVDAVLGAAQSSVVPKGRGLSMAGVLCTEMDLIRRGETRARFIPTGIAEVDKTLGGIPRGVVTVFGARPGIGKSTSALAVCDSASAAGYGVHVLSLEDPAWRYAHRLIARRTGVPVGSLALAGKAQISVPSNWILDDTVGHTAKSACRSVRAQAKTNDTRLVVIDYVQLLRGDDARSPEHVRIQDAMAECTALARDLDAGVLVVSQLNRNTNERDRPSMADLKASGSLEEVAKLVVLLSRSEDDQFLNWHVCKNNFGVVKDIQLNWDGGTCRIW